MHRGEHVPFPFRTKHNDKRQRHHENLTVQTPSLITFMKRFYGVCQRSTHITGFLISFPPAPNLAG